ncbi:hypothetical protein LO763_26870 [Glycomyces sp. A-F 0318]|uniref:hypothetical protein n=1 Tax=Glycomyces amatae TaxID=2881355 RepID=UPI001E6531F3|nr:hypothetical protein [Glycomyces amatae]MCD0447244.1 hypothetical protein [Glycomyces amatae]
MIAKQAAPAGPPRTRPEDRTGVLEEAGTLVLLPDDRHATDTQVAAFYEVPVEQLRHLVRRHREELRAAGLADLRGEALREFKFRFRGELPPEAFRARRLQAWTRQAILAAGQLLTGSAVAERVRGYLLATESSTRPGSPAAARAARLRERTDYRNVLDSLKLGGGVSEDYRLVQNALYAGLFGMTAGVIRETREQLAGARRHDGSFTASSARVAKNYLTADELRTLDGAVAAVNAQLEVRHPRGATRDQMLEVVRRAVSLFRASDPGTI